MTPLFPLVDGELWVGECKVADLVAEFGSPLYVYDAGVIEAAYRRFEEAFAGVDHLLAYSVKANSNMEVLRRLQALGAGADIVSRGELHRCLAAGFSANDLVFAGVGKTQQEMEAALEAGILAFNVESAEVHDAAELPVDVDGCLHIREHMGEDLAARRGSHGREEEAIVRRLGPDAEVEHAELGVGDGGGGDGG